MLEATGTTPATLAGWNRRVRMAVHALGWPAGPVIAVPHPGGASLALSAPPDQLFTATEVNEWALAATLAEEDPARRDELIALLAAEQPEEAEPPVLEEAGAIERLARRAAREANAGLRALLAEAGRRGIPCLGDDEQFTIGAGKRGRTWPLVDLPDPPQVPWDSLAGIPVALVTGTNGKTTVVRLIAACAREAGRVTGWCCTDGVHVDAEALASGDYSGPAGARRVLRDARVECAVLETARGGILRRGLAVPRADAAVVTSIAADHFGEYGVHDLAGLAQVKLAVARALGGDGRLVVNAEDATLAKAAPEAGKTLAWFARDASNRLVAAHRAAGGAACAVVDGRLVLWHGGVEHDLGAIAHMPLAAGGHSAFNVANLAAAALAAAGLGIAPATIAAVCARFGANPADNPGRLMRYELGGLNLVVDFAHNPAALAGLVDFALRLRGRGRLAILLGQAGNREDADLHRLASVAAAARPDLVVLKELSGYLRGRGAGEVRAILRRALARAGLPDAAIEDAPDELSAVRRALAWARPGDALLLAVHTREGRAAALELIEALRARSWIAGRALPT
ncbi:MAG TPA: Mur ligase family protein [Steroidobacteraceae bacterium]